MIWAIAWQKGLDKHKKIWDYRAREKIDRRDLQHERKAVKGGAMRVKKKKERSIMMRNMLFGKGRKRDIRLRQWSIILKHLVEKEKCYFCGKPLIDGFAWQDVNIVEHHINGRHEDNRVNNRVLAHRSCHRAYHMKSFEIWKKRKNVKAKGK
jgi:hypothetical protein